MNAEKLKEFIQRLEAIQAHVNVLNEMEHERRRLAGQQQPGDTLSNARWVGISLTGRTDAGNGSASQA